MRLMLEIKDVTAVFNAACGPDDGFDACGPDDASSSNCGPDYGDCLPD